MDTKQVQHLHLQAEQRMYMAAGTMTKDNKVVGLITAPHDEMVLILLLQAQL